MKNSSIVGALLILAAVILVSALQVCSALSDVSAATMGFSGTSELSAVTISLYIISGVLLVAGIGAIVAELTTKTK